MPRPFTIHYPEEKKFPFQLDGDDIIATIPVTVAGQKVAVLYIEAYPQRDGTYKYVADQQYPDGFEESITPYATSKDAVRGVVEYVLGKLIGDEVNNYKLD
jgi:hypothetical protein